METINIKYTCPCCGYKTFDREDHHWEICEVCFWESCSIQDVEPLYLGGPNHISLTEAQQNFIEFGACEKVSLSSVRKPRADEPKDENWKQVNIYNLHQFNIKVRNDNEIFDANLSCWINKDYGLQESQIVELSLNNETFSIINFHEDFENMLFNLQKSLPPNYKITTCFFCRFSCYHPVGNDNFGALDCFKKCKEKMAKVEGKHELLELYREEKNNVQKVEETSYCVEFQLVEKDDWVYKRQV
jgi:Cysteine-rich CPCC